jgi:hypothetical protein
LNDSYYRNNVVNTLRRDVTHRETIDPVARVEDVIRMTKFDNWKFSRYKSKWYSEHFLRSGVPLSVVIYYSGGSIVENT